MNLKAGPDDQELNLAVGTNSKYTWTNPNCKNAGAHADFCNEQKVYKPAGNHLQEPVPIAYGTGEAIIEPFSAAIKFGGSELRNFHLGVAKDSTVLPVGILALGPVPAGEEKYSILHSLVDQNLIQSRAFGVDLAYETKSTDGTGVAQHEDQKDAGSIIFGGIDTSRFSGSLERLPMQPFTGKFPKYRVKLDKMSFSSGGHRLAAYGGVVVTLDTGASHHYFPSNLLKDISKELGGTIENKMLMVPCNYRERSGNLKYQFGKKEIVTSFADLIEEPYEQDDKLCQVRIAEGPAHKVVLGMPFFESAYTVFDQENGQFYVAQAANCGSTVDKITKGLDGVPLESQCPSK